MPEVFNSWPISLETSLRIKRVLRVIHCCPRTRTRFAHVHARARARILTRMCHESFCRSREEPSLATGYTCEKFQGSQTAALAAAAASCKSLADFAQWRASSFARNKKWTTAISRVNYPAVSKLKLPARLPNIYMYVYVYRKVEFVRYAAVRARRTRAEYSDCGIKRSLRNVRENVKTRTRAQTGRSRKPASFAISRCIHFCVLFRRQRP